MRARRRPYHVVGEEVELGAVQPLAALLTAVQRLVPGGEHGPRHPARAQGLLGEVGARLAGSEHKHYAQTRGLVIINCIFNNVTDCL